MAGSNILEDRDYCGTCMGTIFDFIDAGPEQEDSADTGTENGVLDRDKESVPEAGQPDPKGEAAKPIVEAPGSSAGTGKKAAGQQVRKPRKNSVDRGKILALREIGWSFGKIADDMGLSEQSVCNAFYRWKNAQEEQMQE